MMRYFIILILLLFSFQFVNAGSFLDTAEMVLNNKEMTPVDFSKLTSVECIYDLYMQPVNSRTGWPIYDISGTYFLDIKNKKVYTNEEKPVDSVSQFDDNYIVFTVSYTDDKRLHTKTYKLNRYTGTVTVDGTIRHQYGAIANFTYANINFSGRGTCKPLGQGKKF